MKILSVIKSHKVLTVALAVLITIGAGSAVYATTQRSEEAKVVNSAQVNQVEKTDTLDKTEKVEAPATEDSEVAPVKASTESNQTTLEEVAPVQLTRNEVLTMSIKARDAYKFSNPVLQTRAVYNAVTVNYDKNPSLFTEDNAENSIQKCYAYLDDVKPEVVSLNISKGDCGL